MTQPLVLVFTYILDQSISSNGANCVTSKNFEIRIQNTLLIHKIKSETVRTRNDYYHNLAVTNDNNNPMLTTDNRVQYAWEAYCTL